MTCSTVDRGISGIVSLHVCSRNIRAKTCAGEAPGCEYKYALWRSVESPATQAMTNLLVKL